MGLIKFIIIGFGVYYLVKITLKALFPFLVKKTFDKMQDRAQQMHDSTNTTQEPKGKVTVNDTKSNRGSDKKSEIGDYVDFEEVD